jgi:hypothetical protein
VEAIIGVLFVLALAIVILITPRVDLLEALFVDVSKITLTDTIITVLPCLKFMSMDYNALVCIISKEKVWKYYNPYCDGSKTIRRTDFWLPTL